MKCEACLVADVEIEYDSDDPCQPYKICHECNSRLVTRSLRPSEWFNLASVHGPTKYFLHDDFYDEDGTAIQPEVDVETPEKFPAPKLIDVSAFPEKLLDYAITRWFLDKEAIAALQNIDPKLLLTSIIRRVENNPNEWIEARSYNICACAIGAIAADWIRWRFGISPRLLFLWSEAAAACLPFDEAYSLTLRALENSTNIRGDATSLAWFRTSRTLDWLESRFIDSDIQVTEEWGRLAAVSDLSWSHVEKWLTLGRPLSLIALDAMIACWHYNTLLLKRFQPKLSRGNTTVEEINKVLNDYAAKDAVHRVVQRVMSIKAHLSEICLD